MKTAMLAIVCLARTWPQLGPPPRDFAPPLPKTSEKASTDKPLNYTMLVDITAPEAIKASLESAILLELRKRQDIIIVGTSSPSYRWSLVCATGEDLLVCSSVTLRSLDLADIEKYFPELAKYGVWWSIRYLTEKGSGGGHLAYQGVITGTVSDIPRFAMRAVAAFEVNTIEPARTGKADALYK